MDKFTFVLALFLLVGATKTNGSDVDPPELVSITAPDVTLEPIFDWDAPPPQQINGRLLTPDEGCGYSPLGVPRIVGGGPARNGGYPWMALLGYRWATGNGSSFRCGGSLITSRDVLTAAHCLGDTLWFARLGEHDQRHIKDGPHQDIVIHKQHGHEDYHKANITSDIAVLRLKHDAVFTDRIRPICLPLDDRSYSFENTSPFVAGWGNTKEGGYNVSPYLKHVQVAHVPIPECKKIFYKAYLRDVDLRITNEVVCAGLQTGQSSCQGDSGGPLAAPIHIGNGKFPFFQLGAVSWSMGCARVPTVYASVKHFGDWIKSKVELPFETPPPPPSKPGLFSQIKKLFS